MPRPPTKQLKRRLEKQSQTAKESGNLTSQCEVVLLAVTGMSPAILTETVWALAQENPPVVPDRVVVLTTTAGKEQIERQLFTPQSHFNNQCGWDCLREKLQECGHDIKGRLRFDPGSDDLRLFHRWEEKSHRKLALSDIRAVDENDAVADYILEVVRTFVEDADTRVIASIAGGRKTMGTLLYACMTLIGRETDRLTHVLVSEPFDDPRLKPRFYFPDQPSKELRIEEKTVYAAEARIDLADVPFVPLQNLFQKQLVKKPCSFTRLIESCCNDMRRIAINGLKLKIRRSRTGFEVNDIVIRTSPREHILLLFLAEQALEGKSRWAQYIDVEDDLDSYRQRMIRTAPHDSLSDWRNHDGLREQISESKADHVTKLVSSLRGKCDSKGGDGAIFATLLPEKGRFSLDLPQKQISVLD
jgi:CRISPR-associated protein (TIGR02584 family)